MREALLLLIEYLIVYFAHRKSAFLIMNEVGMNQRLYDKYSIEPSFFLRKYFKLSKKKVLKYVCYRLYLSLAWGAIGLILIIVCLCEQIDDKFISLIMFIPGIYAIFDSVIALIVTHNLKKK